MVFLDDVSGVTITGLRAKPCTSGNAALFLKNVVDAFVHGPVLDSAPSLLYEAMGSATRNVVIAGTTMTGKVRDDVAQDAIVVRP